MYSKLTYLYLYVFVTTVSCVRPALSSRCAYR